MWASASRVFLAGVLVSFLVTEVVRAVLHRHRVRIDGLGGTQDVAMWGTLAMFACLLAAAMTGLASFLLR
jgi:hypothetical protein